MLATYWMMMVMGVMLMFGVIGLAGTVLKAKRRK